MSALATVSYALKRPSKGVVISRHTGECVDICVQKFMLCLIILTFKHEKMLLVSFKMYTWLPEKNIQRTIERKTYKKNKIFMKVEYL